MNVLNNAQKALEDLEHKEVIFLEENKLTDFFNIIPKHKVFGILKHRHRDGVVQIVDIDNASYNNFGLCNCTKEKIKKEL